MPTSRPCAYEVSEVHAMMLVYPTTQYMEYKTDDKYIRLTHHSAHTSASPSCSISFQSCTSS